jgi:hypothetical protein
MDLRIVGMEMPSLPRPSKKKRKRKRTFKVRWVKLPFRWVKALRRTKVVSAHWLAHIILVETFRCEQGGGEIVLTTKVTGMHRNTRLRAAKELVKLKLIRIQQVGQQDVRVSLIN